MHDVEVTGDVKIRAHLLEFRLLDRPMFKGQTNLVQGSGVLTDAVIGLAGRVYPFLEVLGEGDVQATGQSRLPRHQLPIAATSAILATLYECSVDLDCYPRQMLPLVPGGIPHRV